MKRIARILGMPETEAIYRGPNFGREIERHWESLAGNHGYPMGMVKHFAERDAKRSQDSKLDRWVESLGGESPDDWPVRRLHLAFLHKGNPTPSLDGNWANPVYLRNKRLATEGAEVLIYDHHSHIGRITLLRPGADGSVDWRFLEFDDEKPLMREVSPIYPEGRVPTLDALEKYEEVIRMAYFSNPATPKTKQ